MTSATATKAKSSRRPWWLSQPSTAFLRDPHFYTKYDIVWSALAISISATLWFALDWRGFDVAFTMANAPLLAGLFV
ncbi:MAG: hypothetical protein ACI9KE_005208, partial [Polyangiales bacterium]